MSIVSDAFAEAVETMTEMIVNEGQRTIFADYIFPEFQAVFEATRQDPCEGWDDVDAGDYADFMGEICEAGNSIMQDAYEYACDIREIAEAFL